jgi:hypothetical protein
MGKPRKLVPNQVLEGIPHTDWNLFCDATDRVLGAQEVGKSRGGRWNRHYQKVACNATTTETFSIWQVDQANGALPSTLDYEEVRAHQSMILVGAPGATWDINLGPYVIVEDVVQGNTEDAYDAIIDGITPCRVDISDVNHTYATPKLNERGYLDSSEEPSHFRILDIESSGTGIKWCLVMFTHTNDGEKLWQFTATENMGNTTTDQMAATRQDLSGSGTDPITIYDPLDNWWHLRSGEKGHCIQVGDKYYPVVADNRRRYQYYRATSSQSISTGGETKIGSPDFQGLRFDGGAGTYLRQHDDEPIFQTNNQFRYAGHYRAKYSLQLEHLGTPSVAHDVEAYFKLGGTIVGHSARRIYEAIGTTNTDFRKPLEGFCVVEAAANDTFELYVNRHSSTTISVEEWNVEVEDIIP